jgi:hypothetical protein
LFTHPRKDLSACICAEAIFRDSEREDASLISYEEFGQWYNSGGYAVAPWLELLDLSKWPGMAGVAYRRAPASQSTAEDTEEGGSDGEAADVGKGCRRCGFVSV